MTDPAKPFPADVLEDMGDMPNYNDWIVSQFDRLLANGGNWCGAGNDFRAVAPFVDRLDLIEPTQALADRLREKFAGDERCSVAEQTLESWMETTPDGIYDAVVMVNVLEHIEDDRAAARGLFAAMKPGGKLLIFVPALPFYAYSELDRIYGHFRRYQRKDLSNCIESAGFRIERLRYFDITGVFPWWLLNTVIGKHLSIRRFSGSTTKLCHRPG